MAAPFSSTAGAPPGQVIGGMLWNVTGPDADNTAARPTGLTAIGPFFFQNLVTGASATENFCLIGVSAVSNVTMPKPGSFLGYSMNLDLAPTAGTNIVKVYKNIVALGGIFTSPATSAKTFTAFTQNLASATFARGDKVTVSVTTSGPGYNPGAAVRDVSVYLWTT